MGTLTDKVFRVKKQHDGEQKGNKGKNRGCDIRTT